MPEPELFIDEPEEEVIEQSAPEQKVYTVGEINKAIKSLLEGEFQYLWLQGEISNFKAHTSGHYYFSLKDERAQISAVMFRGFNSKLKFSPDSGMEVLVRGKVTVYEPRGNYQVFVEHMEPVGAGALQKAYEQLKAKLDQEGLFSQEHKKQLPSQPTKVAVVTSPTGAAIRDILNVLSRRSPRIEVTVIPARVQGDLATNEVAKAIELANQVGDYDVMIVGRGGGSIEDLWCFNEERVARAIFASEIPVISAVGHEIDFTIADFVADLRAPTPSAAAELVAESEEQLQQKLNFYKKALVSCMQQSLRQKKMTINNLAKSLVDPRTYLRDSIQRCDELLARLTISVRQKLQKKRLEVKAWEGRIPSPKGLVARHLMKLEHIDQTMGRILNERLRNGRNRMQYLVGMLDSLSPLLVVKRGYAIVRKGNELVQSINEIKKNDEINIQVKDGTMTAKVESTKKGQS